MRYPEYVREKAVALRRDRDLGIDEIAERLAIPRTTIYHWVKDMPLREENTRPRKLAQVRAAEATRAKHQRLRDEAYELGRRQWAILQGERTFREFVALYIAEGFKRNRNTVSIANSDSRVMAMAVSWFRRLTDRTLVFYVQFHADQDLEELREFWAMELSIDPGEIRLLRKSNSNQLAKRTWRSEHGVLTVRISDTYLRARLQAWIDLIRAEWTLDSAEPGCGAAW